ncbi:MAG: hypothetical protein ACK452_16720 [Bacteroidota bacterium]|jgi:hypothetical protein
MRKLFFQLGLCSALVTLFSCGGSKETEEKTKDTTVAVSKKDSTAELKEFKFFMILANVPSPAKEVVEIQKSGMKYNASLLNPKENESKYSENTKVCLNYGVYASDLAYCASFKDNPDLMSYFLLNRKMADKAGALSVFEEIIKQENFESHTKNVDSLELILDKAYMATEKFCEDQHKLDIAVKILIGSWIEGQHLTLSTINGLEQNAKNKKLFEKVWENFLHLRNINDLLSEYENHPELNDLKTQLKAYAEIYNDAHGVEDMKKDRISKLYEAMSKIRASVIS